MAAAYATFPNSGIYVEPYSYTKVVDSDNNIVLEHIVNSHRVYREDSAFLMCDMLKDVITSGTAAGKVQLITNSAGENIAVAGKTGTTDDNIDKWFCGFTPYYAAAVWYGYDNRLRTTEIPKADRSNAIYIWNYVMQRIHTDCAAASFVKPDNIITREVCTFSGLLATDECRAAGTTVTDYFIDGDYLTPQDACPFHVPTPTPEPTPEPLPENPV